MNTLDIYVRYSAGAYSCRLGKLTASSTMSGEAAAQRLAEKVFGPALIRVERVGDEVNCASAWLATADPVEFAWAWADGSIEFGATVPDDAIVIARGLRRALVQVVSGLAATRSGQPWVPDVAPGMDQVDARVNLSLWVNKHAPENGNPARLGVLMLRAHEVVPE